MKILDVNARFDPVLGGGSVERTFQTSRLLAKFGVESTVLTLDIDLDHQQIKKLKGVNLIALPGLIKRFRMPLFSYKAIKEIVNNADVIHLINHWTFLNALVYIIARRLKKPYVICPAGSLAIYGRSKILKRIYNFVIGKSIVRNANRCIAISVNEIPQFESYGAEPEKISVIANGINSDDFKRNDNVHFREKYNLKNYPFILFVGRLNHIKGPDLLLRAFCEIKNKIPALHLVFAGPDEGMLTELKDIVINAGLQDDVHFLGYLGNDDKVAAYYESELLAIPSRQEAMSIVVLEAAMTETPVLITNECGFNEVEDFNGGLVVPASVIDLQKGLAKMLGNTADLNAMGKSLKKHVSNHFTWDAIVNKYIELYREILAEA
ncbi:glycosyltransferase [Planctomycetota bacterium]